MGGLPKCRDRDLCIFDIETEQQCKCVPLKQMFSKTLLNGADGISFRFFLLLLLLILSIMIIMHMCYIQNFTQSSPSSAQNSSNMFIGIIWILIICLLPMQCVLSEKLWMNHMRACMRKRNELAADSFNCLVWIKITLFIFSINSVEKRKICSCVYTCSALSHWELFKPD